MKYLSSKDIKVFLTTDHGTIKVDKPVKIKASRDVNNNIRFKYGKNISSEEKKIFINDNGEEIFLPKINIFNGLGMTFDWYLRNPGYYLSLKKKDITARLGNKVKWLKKV